METSNTPAQVPLTDSQPNVPLSQVLAIALICGSLTFGCLYSAFHGKANTGHQVTVVTASPTDTAVPSLAANSTP